MTSDSSSMGRLAGLVVVFGGYLLIHGGQELRYRIWGKDASATVTHATASQYSVRGTPWTRLRIDYRYVDSDGVRQDEFDEQTTNCPVTVPATGQSIAVQYIKPGTSRLATDASPVSLALCVVVLATALMWKWLASTD